MFGQSGHGLFGRARVGRARQQLELMHGAGALAVRGAEAVGAGVAAADDDDVLVLRRDEPIVGDVVALAAAVLQRQILHREVNARELAAGHRQIARARGAAGEHDRIELGAKLVDRHVDADVAAGAEDDAFLAQELRAVDRAGASPA